MGKPRKAALAACLALILAAGSLIAAAQNRRGFDPEQMRIRMMEDLKTQMQITDDEWTVIQPLFEDVMEKQRAIMMQNVRRMMPGGGPPPGMGPGDGPPPGMGPGGFPPMKPDPEFEALQSILEEKDASPDDIKTKLAAFRTARSKKQDELKTAREKLRSVLTVRQEAILVLRGALD